MNMIVIIIFADRFKILTKSTSISPLIENIANEKTRSNLLLLLLLFVVGIGSLLLLLLLLHACRFVFVIDDVLMVWFDGLSDGDGLSPIFSNVLSIVGMLGIQLLLCLYA